MCKFVQLKCLNWSVVTHELNICENLIFYLYIMEHTFVTILRLIPLHISILLSSKMTKIRRS